jgi:iron complex outermembrane receptor protein
MTLVVAPLVLCAATLSGQTLSAPNPPDVTGLSLEDLLEAEVVYAASRRIQTLREAPSAVSVVTAAEIREHGYRTLADVLRSLPSFYVTEDRRYSYVGVRGFDRPGDYGARILLLLDGLRTNDNVFEQAYIGQEFLVDIDLVDRIEVVRGPSAAIYGNSAFFAVVNVVTRPGRDFQGAELSGTAASFGTRAGRASYGRQLANGFEFLVSASLSDNEGRRLYFKEFDSPETRHGIADKIDSERFNRALVTLSKGSFTFEASHVSRDKGIPTGVYGSIFGDPITRSTDAKDLASLTYARSLSANSSMMARVHYGFSDYHGTYAFKDVGPNLDYARGQWWGFEASAARPLGARHLLTAGLEFEDDFSQQQRNLDQGTGIVYQDSHNSSDRLGLFAQDEITLSKRFTVYAGLRQDWYSNFGYQVSPRLGLIYDEGRATALKLLYGRAFRGPNDFELHYDGPVYRINPDLRPETIRTTELVLEQKLGQGLRLNASAYYNEIDDLVTVQRDPEGLFFFDNAGRSDSVGLEVGVEIKRAQGPSAHVSYAAQRSREYGTAVQLTNSPRHVVKAQLACPLFGKRITAAADGWYLSDRRTLAGAHTGSSVVANATLVAPRILEHFDLSASVYNVFDRIYSDPGAPEHLQDLIAQDGRNFRLKVSLRF